MVNKNKSFFWASYADLMTSLFFVMLALFVLAAAVLNNTVQELNDTVEELEKINKQVGIAKDSIEKKLAKINEINNAINQIDNRFFEYNQEYKKHVMKIDVSFETASANMSDISELARNELKLAGKSIDSFIRSAHAKFGVDYLLIIEGQTSKDNYIRNYQLSYERALSLIKFWVHEGLNFNIPGCELIIAGSGQSGLLRVYPDIPGNKSNQRFLIHILPKPGQIE